MKSLKFLSITVLSALALTACTEAEIEKVNSTPASTASSSAATTAVETKESEAPEETIYKVGDSVKFDNLIITVNGVRNSQSEFMKPEEGNQIILVDVTAENKGTDEESVSSMLLTEVVDGDGYKYDVTIVDDNKGSFDGSIGAGRKLRGEIAFEVPEAASSLEFIFSNPFKTGQAIWKIK